MEKCWVRLYFPRCKTFSPMQNSSFTLCICKKNNTLRQNTASTTIQKQLCILTFYNILDVIKVMNTFWRASNLKSFGWVDDDRITFFGLTLPLSIFFSKGAWTIEEDRLNKADGLEGFMGFVLRCSIIADLISLHWSVCAVINHAQMSKTMQGMEGLKCGFSAWVQVIAGL